MFNLHKTLSLLLICLFILYTQQQLRDPAFLQTFQKYFMECGTEANIDPAVVNKSWNENHFLSDNAFKCFFKCLNIKLGVMDSSGEVIDDVLKSYSAQFVDNSTDREIVEECGAIKGADLCETAFQLMVCIKQAELD